MTPATFTTSTFVALYVEAGLGRLRLGRLRHLRSTSGVEGNARFPAWTTTFMFSMKPSSQCSGSIATNVMPGLSACASSAGVAFARCASGAPREMSTHPPVA